MIILAILAVLLFAAAGALAFAIVREPQARRSENLEQIEAYGYARLTPPPRKHARARRRRAADRRRARRRREPARGRDPARAVSAPGSSSDRGPPLPRLSRPVPRSRSPILLIWFFGTARRLGARLSCRGREAIVGWVGPKLRRRAASGAGCRDRRRPAGLIDLLVVTLEAGVAFTGALRLAAERIDGPLGEEVRLTIQEQSLGLSTLEALENWLRRCDTPVGPLVRPGDDPGRSARRVDRHDPAQPGGRDAGAPQAGLSRSGRRRCRSRSSSRWSS